MKLFEELQHRVEHWLDRLDRERDLAMGCVAREGPRDHLVAWLQQLDVERAKHLRLIAKLEELRSENHPALLLSSRPTRQVKAELRHTPPARKAVS